MLKDDANLDKVLEVLRAHLGIHGGHTLRQRDRARQIILDWLAPKP